MIVDVASGRWTFVLPRPAVSRELSSSFSREATDQNLVARLKAAGYQSLADALFESHTE